MHESNQSLWLMAAGPLIWTAHFLVTYITVAVWCAKVADYDGALGGTRWAIGVYTLIALAGIGAIAAAGHSRQRLGTGATPHDFDSPEDRHRFLGFATLLLAPLSAVATIFVALAAVFIGRCH